MFRRSPRTALLSVAAALVAVVTATTMIRTISSLRHQDEAFGRLSPVVVARRDLPVGTRIRSADLTSRRVRGEQPGADTVTRASGAVGRVVRSSLLRGDAITARHLTAARRGALSDVVPSGHRAVRIVIEHGLRPAVGDLVDVFATFDPATLGDGGDPTILIAPAVPVLAVDTTAAAADTVGITLLVTPREASGLAFSVATGTPSIALAPPEAGAGRG